MVHITYPILCMSYSYTYITFMVIYYTICYVLFSCTVIMYCHRALFSRTFIMYCVHVLISYTVFMYCSCSIFIYCFPVILFILLSLSCTVLVHILFVYCTLYFPYTVFMYCFMYYVLFIYCHLVLFIYCIIILTFQIILHSYTFSYIMSDRIISCYRTYHHIAVLCFSDHIISFHMSYSNHLFYVSCLHKP